MHENLMLFFSREILTQNLIAGGLKVLLTMKELKLMISSPSST